MTLHGRARPGAVLPLTAVHVLRFPSVLVSFVVCTTHLALGVLFIFSHFPEFTLSSLPAHDLAVAHWMLPL